MRNDEDEIRISGVFTEQGTSDTKDRDRLWSEIDCLIENRRQKITITEPEI